MDTFGTFPTATGERYYDLSELPPPDHAIEAYVTLRAEYAPAYAALKEKRDAYSKVSVELKHAEACFLKDAVEAKRKGKTHKDPRPALREREQQAQVDVAVAEAVCVELSNGIYDLRNDPAAQAEWKAKADGLRATLLERATRQRDELEETMTELGKVAFAAAWSSQKAKVVRGTTLGSAELNKLAKLISVHGDRRPTRFVRQDAMRRLQLGETVEDTNGGTLTPAEADALLRARKLRVAHGGSMLPRSGASAALGIGEQE